MDRKTTIIAMYLEKQATAEELNIFKEIIRKRELTLQFELVSENIGDSKKLMETLGFHDIPEDIKAKIRNGPRLDGIVKIKNYYKLGLKESVNMYDALAQEYEKIIST